MSAFANANPVPPVSVAMCTYNGEKYLKQQLDSILSQDCEAITEIVCVDDNSTDATWQILEEYAAQYPVFRIVRNEKNLGFVRNFEKAFTLTTNQFIAISDQDDVWYPQKIRKLVQAIDNKLLAFSDNEFIDQNGQQLGKRLSSRRNLVPATSCLSFTLFNIISGHTVLFNRDLLQSAIPFPTGVPFDFWLGFLAAQHASMQVVPEVLVGYRQHETNVIGGVASKKKANKQVLDFDPARESETTTRIKAFLSRLAPERQHEKKVLEFILESYYNRSFGMRCKRIVVFWENRDELLLFKKRSKLRKNIYCIKAFWKYD